MSHSRIRALHGHFLKGAAFRAERRSRGHGAVGYASTIGSNPVPEARSSVACRSQRRPDAPVRLRSPHEPRRVEPLPRLARPAAAGSNARSTVPLAASITAILNGRSALGAQDHVPFRARSVPCIPPVPSLSGERDATSGAGRINRRPVSLPAKASPDRARPVTADTGAISWRPRRRHRTLPRTCR